MVSPQGLSLESMVVAMATPVAKRPQARRNASARGGWLELSGGIALDKVLTLILS